MKKKQLNVIRNKKIDVVKGIAVFLVIWGHYIQYTSANAFNYFENHVFKFIYSFHMPLFALLSGYLFYGTLQRKNLKDTIYSRIKGLIIPIIIWTTINWLISSLQQKNIDLVSWWRSFTGIYLWFLWSILAISICLSLNIKVLSNKIHALGILMGFFAMYLFPNPEMSLYIYPFFIIGYYFCKNKENLKKYINNKYNFLIIFIFILLLFFYKKECYIYTTGITIWYSKVGVVQQIVIDIYRYIIGLLGSMSVIIIINKIVDKIPKVIKNFLVNCGKYSMQIYILQSLILKIYSIVWNKFVKLIGVNILAKNMILYDLIITPTLSLITILIILIIARYIEKNKKVNLFLFGR